MKTEWAQERMELLFAKYNGRAFRGRTSRRPLIRGGSPVPTEMHDETQEARD